MIGCHRQILRILSVLTLAIGLTEPGLASAVGHLTPRVTIVLEPEAPNPDGMVPGLKVTIRSEGESVKAGQAILRMPRVAGNVATAANAMEDFSVADSKGPVPLTIRDDGEGDLRRWIAGRAVEGPFVVHYHVAIISGINPRGGGAPFELRSEGGGFSGALNAFAPLPDTETPQRVSLKWNFSAFGKDAVGLSSFGFGDVDSPEAIPVVKLSHAFFMGGRLGQYPTQPGPQGFFGAWQGATPFDAPALLQWTEGLYGHYRQFFGKTETAPFGVFLRPRPKNSGGNVAVLSGFVGTYGPQTDPETIKPILAHEMVHVFVGGLDGLGESPAQSWYSEGMADFYSRAFLLRYGLISHDQFIQKINAAAARYYTNPAIGAPNEDIPRLFWDDPGISVLPYDRGSFYFATVDEEVRKATNGAKSLDDLVLAMLDRRAHGVLADTAAWRSLVRQAVGQKGVDEFDAMLSGGVVEVPSDAFGACFARTTVPLPRYELGFDRKILSEHERIVRGVIPGSAAEKAGVRNGDKLLSPVGQASLLNGEALLNLKIGRGAEVTTITYLPRGEPINVHQWVRTTTSEDLNCAR